jgi:hypothetical protein
MANIKNWDMRLRCTKCKAGEEWVRDAVRRAPGVPLAKDRVQMLCQTCGSSAFDDPRPGRYVSASVWWKPNTWNTGKWEWREDSIEKIETEDTPTPLEMLAKAHNK